MHQEFRRADFLVFLLHSALLKKLGRNLHSRLTSTYSVIFVELREGPTKGWPETCFY
jgi:hypothetical protein